MEFLWSECLPIRLLCLLQLSTENNNEKQCTNCKAVVRSRLVSFQRESDVKNTKWGSFRKESLNYQCEKALSRNSPASKLRQSLKFWLLFPLFSLLFFFLHLPFSFYFHFLFVSKAILPNSLCMLSHSSCVRFFVIPWTVAQQAPLSMGFSRQEYWSGLPCPPPGNPHLFYLLHWQAGSLPPGDTWEAVILCTSRLFFF